MVEGGSGRGGGIKRRVDGNFVSTAALSYQLSSTRLTRYVLSVLCSHQAAVAGNANVTTLLEVEVTGSSNEANLHKQHNE